MKKLLLVLLTSISMLLPMKAAVQSVSVNPTTGTIVAPTVPLKGNFIDAATGLSIVGGISGTNLTLTWGTNRLTATILPWADTTNFYVTPVAWNANFGGKYQFNRYEDTADFGDDVWSGTNGYYTLIFDPAGDFMSHVVTITNGAGATVSYCDIFAGAFSYAQLFTNSVLSSAYFSFFTNTLPSGWSFTGPISGDGSGLSNVVATGDGSGLSNVAAASVSPNFNIYTINSLTGLLQTVSAYLRPILIQDLWSGSGLPTLGADFVTNNVTMPDLSGGQVPTNFLRSDAYVFIEKDNSGNHLWTNLVYSFVPTNSVTKLVIYHAGHDFGGSPPWVLGQPIYLGSPTAYNAGSLVKQLVENGYTVAAIGMPYLNGFDGYGAGIPNPTATLNYLRVWIEPTIRVINQFGATKVFMTGISGGGWTTTVAAALDPRIVVSAPTAGSLPFYVTNVTSRGWEQWLPGLPTNCDYTNLYVLGTTGGRTQVQVLSSADGVFSGNWISLFPNDYAIPTAFQASCVGGNWSRYITPSIYHSFDVDEQTNIVNLFNSH